jgi:methionyl-tRNA formyltransferase
MLDAGPMFAKATRPIDPNETPTSSSVTLRNSALPCSCAWSIRCLRARCRRSSRIRWLCSYAPKITREEGLIDWTLPAIDIHNRVRGLYPWPHAYTYLQGKRLIVLKTRVETEAADAEPGTVVDASGDAIHVAAGHGSRIAIEQLQPEGKRPMTARQFLAGHPIEPGARMDAR